MFLKDCGVHVCIRVGMHVHACVCAWVCGACWFVRKKFIVFKRYFLLNIWDSKHFSAEMFAILYIQEESIGRIRWMTLKKISILAKTSYKLGAK